MQYFVGINQKALVEISQETNIKLDLADGNIIDFISKYAHTGSLQAKMINNKVYYWISYQKVIDENPLLNINDKETIARRMTKLCNAGIFNREIIKEEGNKTFFAFSENYKRIVDWGGIDSKVDRVSTQKSEGVSTQKSNNQYTNKSIYQNQREIKETELEVQFETPNSKEEININSLSEFFQFSQTEKEDMTIYRQLNILNIFLQGHEAKLKISDLEKIKAMVKPEDYSKNFLNKKNFGGWIGDYISQQAQEKIKQFTITKIETPENLTLENITMSKYATEFGRISWLVNQEDKGELNTKEAILDILTESQVIPNYSKYQHLAEQLFSQNLTNI